MLSYAFTLLLLGTFANCATNTPHYLKAQVDINHVLGILDDQILSMDKHLPLLNDTRRQYAKIVHVIHSIGVVQSSCVHEDYEESYQSQISEFIPEAVNNPRVVIEEVREQKEAFLKSTPLIRRVIRDACFLLSYELSNSDSHPCDDKVQQEVDNLLFLKGQARILLAAGKAANSFLARHNEFLASTKTHSTTPYIVYGVSLLKEVIMDSAEYRRVYQENRYDVPKC